MNMIQRLKAPTPKIVKKLQKIAGAIGGLGTVITTSISMFPSFEFPKWIPIVILSGTAINHILLQLFTEDDN